MPRLGELEGGLGGKLCNGCEHGASVGGFLGDYFMESSLGAWEGEN